MKKNIDLTQVIMLCRKANCIETWYRLGYFFKRKTYRSENNNVIKVYIYLALITVNCIYTNEQILFKTHTLDILSFLIVTLYILVILCL